MEKRDLECVYIISLSFNEEKLNYWKNEIRSKLSTPFAESIYP